MSGELVLNREAMRVVERNDKGNVTYRKRYKQGDVVDTSKIDDVQVENLRRTGALVEKSAYDADLALRNPDAVAPATQTVANPSHSGYPVSDEQHEASYDSDEEEQEHEGSDTDPDKVDGYAEMAFADLQSLAKSRDLNAGGSAEDLRARLREADADEADDDDA